MNPTKSNKFNELKEINPMILQLLSRLFAAVCAACGWGNCSLYRCKKCDLLYCSEHINDHECGG